MRLLQSWLLCIALVIAPGCVYSLPVVSPETYSPENLGGKEDRHTVNSTKQLSGNLTESKGECYKVYTLDM